MIGTKACESCQRRIGSIAHLLLTFIECFAIRKAGYDHGWEIVVASNILGKYPALES